MTKMAMSKFAAVLAFLAALAFPLGAGAQVQERILSYHSDIAVQEDSSLVVKETITVVSTGDQIRRGIYRDFPMAYTDTNGRRYRVTFELMEVMKDGTQEPYSIERAGNGLRIYIGQADVFLSPGAYEYSITYKTGRQLGFYETRDELYWNVTGNGWEFPIHSASAVVRLPGEVDTGQVTAALYTGPQGSTEQNGTWRVRDGRVVEFAASEPLSASEGLTIVVGWPKGMVTPPNAAENVWAALQANMDYIVALLGLLMVLSFYLYMWHKRGRDPKRGTVIPQYGPPRGFSPALLRYIYRMGSDDKTFTSSIIHLGVKGRLSLQENNLPFQKDTYTLLKKEGPQNSLPAEEKILEGGFFKNGVSFELEQGKASEISEIKNNFSESLKDQAGKQYFSKNSLVLFLGILLSMAAVVGTVVAAAWVRYGAQSLLQVLFWPGLIVALLAINILFGWLVRAYTREGRALADEIEGFKLFLGVTEKDRLAFHNPPEKTPELFEKMLPYALALGVEHQWAEQFSEVFAGLKEKGMAYAPAWYHGSLGSFNPAVFVSKVGSSFAGVVSSASTPPGSRSGFSGGSSGGGGGGGGGGGW